ncbi:hypothetical protein JZU68_03585 [bacterium]|nr:hypothetical protein [bacterium]
MPIENSVKVCDPRDCKTLEYVGGVIDKLESIVGRLADSQHAMELNVAKLTENMDTVRRLHDRLDKVEVSQETIKAIDSRVIKTEISIEQLKSFMWKAVGAVGIIAFFMPIIMKVT